MKNATTTKKKKTDTCSVAYIVFYLSINFAQIWFIFFVKMRVLLYKNIRVDIIK